MHGYTNRNGSFGASEDGLTVWFTQLNSSAKNGAQPGVCNLMTQAEIRRIGFVADLLVRNGVIVPVPVISAYRENR